MATKATKATKATAVTNKKIYKGKGAQVTPTETQVAKALLDLEISSKDLAPELKDLYISSAREVELGGGRKVLLIFVPHRLHSRFRKIQSRLIRELEKKFSGRHVVIVAQRTILSKNYTRQSKGAIRPRSRTLSAVYDAILEDIVYPTQIVGRRTTIRPGADKTTKIFLDPKDVREVDYKLKSFSAAYKALTNRRVEFLFPIE